MTAVFHPGFTPLPRSAAPRRAGAVAAVALHGLAAATLAGYEPVRTAALSAAPIMVKLVSAPRAQPAPAPRMEPPKSRPVPEPARAVASPTLSSLPLATATEPLTAAAPAATQAAPVAQPARPAPPVEAVAAVAPAAPVTPPAFDAGYLDNPAPAYPPLSRRMREEGRVLLRVHVDAGGAADEVQVRTSSGAPRLDAAALETVRRWKFVPARRGAEAVPAWVLVPISFRLES